jgi:hypothetical protein
MAPETCCSKKKSSRAPWFTLVPGTLLALLAPKCPFCLAAYLSLVGLGAGTAGVLAPMLRPFGIALIVLSLVLLGVGYARRFSERAGQSGSAWERLARRLRGRAKHRVERS